MEENEDEDEERALVGGILFCGRQKYTHRLPKWLGRAGATHVVYSTCCTPHAVLHTMFYITLSLYMPLKDTPCMPHATACDCVLTCGPGVGLLVGVTGMVEHRARGSNKGLPALLAQGLT